MGAHHFVQLLFAFSGLFALLAAICNWEWFFTAQNSQLVVRSVGRKGARLLYGVGGGVMIGIAVFLYLHS